MLCVGMSGEVLIEGHNKDLAVGVSTVNKNMGQKTVDVLEKAMSLHTSGGFTVNFY